MTGLGLLNRSGFPKPVTGSHPDPCPSTGVMDVPARARGRSARESGPFPRAPENPGSLLRILPPRLFSRETALSSTARQSRWFVGFFRTEQDPNHRPWREEKAVFVGGLSSWKTITRLSPPRWPQRLASKSLIPKLGLCEENKGALSDPFRRSGVLPFLVALTCHEPGRSGRAGPYLCR